MEWVDWLGTSEEAAAGFPPRPVAKPGFEAELKKRTLTQRYTARPPWLNLAHHALGQAVANAYGCADCTPAMADDEVLLRLPAWNF